MSTPEEDDDIFWTILWAQKDAEDVAVSHEADARFDDAYYRIDALTDELLSLCGDQIEQIVTFTALLCVAQTTMIRFGGPEKTAAFFRHFADKLDRGDFVDPREEEYDA